MRARLTLLAALAAAAAAAYVSINPGKVGF